MIVVYIINDHNGSPSLIDHEDFTEEFIVKSYSKLAKKRKWKNDESLTIDDKMKMLHDWTKDSTEAINSGRYSFINPNFKDEIIDQIS